MLGDATAAAIEAGQVRFRPVLMTALAMIIGMLPMAMGFGEGGEQNAPLGRAVIGGLTGADIVCARALAPLTQLLAWTEPLLTTGTTGLFPKGRDAAAELTEADREWTFARDLIPSRTDSQARIVRVTSLSRVDP